MASCLASHRASTCPPWLQAALADIEQSVQELALGTAATSAAAEGEPDSFAERAENYYRKRPQLIALLHDLHNRYLYLADRYSQSLLKPHHHRRHSSAVSDELPLESSSSDAESSLSFQPLPSPGSSAGGLDLVVAELVATAVERDILLDELGEAADRGRSESARKIELQRSLLEVMESERLVLLGENARLGFRAAAIEEDARAVAAEAGYMRRKASELGRIVMKLREDHRVCLLGRKIEGLQAQIYGLERRNRECYEATVRREAEKGEVRAEIERLRGENCRLRAAAAAAGRRRRRSRKGESRSRWWDRIRRIEWGPCGAYVEARKGCF